ncbi:MAG: penicillin-binding transpeptidase domain-containing protein [Eubacteriales bacterium]|nr:penicillin-binding transpeptidase domain-containing protein [Eubacteriales bacterium]
MLKDFFEILQELAKKILRSRIFALAIVFTCMFAVLLGKLFSLQIIKGEEYQEDYVQLTAKTVTTPGTRGNIYDRSGNLLAYNELAYMVNIQDTGDYKDSASMNAMLLKLVRILNAHGVKAQGKLELALDADGNMIYTSGSEAARKRFLRDYYGLRSLDELDDARGQHPTNITAAEAYQRRYDSYRLGELADADGNPVILTDEEALQIVDIRYTMSLVSYRKYETSTITGRIDDETVADIMEHADELRGVGIEQTTIRVYKDSIYFAPIIGYTGRVQEDQLEELQKLNPEYESNDIVGRTGIEASMETELQGQKGHTELVVNNLGSIMEVVSETQPTTGNDIYLTIDRDLQVGIYHLIEQQLAGILAEALINEDVDAMDAVDASKIRIPVKDAYFQLINNNVLSLSHMAGEEASEIEQEIYRIYTQSKAGIMQQLRYELLSSHAAMMKDLPQDMMAYMVYIYNYLSSEEAGIIQTSGIDTSGAEYLAWKADEISLRDYLYAGIAGGWIDTTKLEVESKYSSADDIYNEIIEFVMAHLEDDTDFMKQIFRYLVKAETITGRQLCLALYAQGVLPYDEEQVRLLTVNGNEYAFTFMREKIRSIELTPAQLALDPCTAGVVITDVNTGEVRALVTYPSYDNNRMSGTVDAAYFRQLQNDLSLPLYNNATQAKKAPGSTFKPITAIAGLEEGVITLDETIDCTGRYTEVATPINCWIYPGHHGPLNVVGGITNSCNYFFSEVAHRLATDEETLVYSTDMGIQKLREYASMFGLDRPSGIEISEISPEMSTEDPERSAMGQGTNSYANIQLARYVAALANRGTVFELSLLDKMTDSEGNLIEDYTPEVSGHVDIAESTWDAVQQGMRGVVTEGSARKIFQDLEVDIAGKTGTAQETRTRGNHAFFISYGPYANPEISVTVNIPYGYSSSNAAILAKNVYRFYFGYTDLDYILNTGALGVSNVIIGD